MTDVAAELAPPNLGGFGTRLALPECRGHMLCYTASVSKCWPLHMFAPSRRCVLAQTPLRMLLQRRRTLQRATLARALPLPAALADVSYSKVCRRFAELPSKLWRASRYVHIRIQQRNGKKSLTTIQVRGRKPPSPEPCPSIVLSQVAQLADPLCALWC